MAAHKLTITISEEIYQGLYRTVGRRRISRFLEDLARPHVQKRHLDEAYREMAADREREAEAFEWVEGLAGDGFVTNPSPCNPAPKRLMAKKSRPTRRTVATR